MSMLRYIFQYYTFRKIYNVYILPYMTEVWNFIIIIIIIRIAIIMNIMITILTCYYHHHHQCFIILSLFQFWNVLTLNWSMVLSLNISVF